MSGEIGIFSIVVNTNVSKLDKLQSNNIIDFIDVKYYPDAEKTAKESGKKLQYVELPLKPDGAN
jgi:hypothetical protein